MIGTVWQWQWWLTAVGPNVVASMLCVVPAIALGVWRMHRHWRRGHASLHERLTDIERKLDPGN